MVTVDGCGAVLSAEIFCWVRVSLTVRPDWLEGDRDTVTECNAATQPFTIYLWWCRSLFHGRPGRVRHTVILTHNKHTYHTLETLDWTLTD